MQWQNSWPARKSWHPFKLIFNWWCCTLFEIPCESFRNTQRLPSSADWSLLHCAERPQRIHHNHGFIPAAQMHVFCWQEAWIEASASCALDCNFQRVPLLCAPSSPPLSDDVFESVLCSWNNAECSKERKMWVFEAFFFLNLLTWLCSFLH